MFGVHAAFFGSSQNRITIPLLEEKTCVPACMYKFFHTWPKFNKGRGTYISYLAAVTKNNYNAIAAWLLPEARKRPDHDDKWPGDYKDIKGICNPSKKSLVKPCVEMVRNKWCPLAKAGYGDYKKCIRTCAKDMDIEDIGSINKDRCTAVTITKASIYKKFK